jgi:signal transduction histidine kinase
VRGWRKKSDELERANRELAEQREQQEQAAIALERDRIARELHDVIAHNVAMMVVQASAAARVLDGDQPQVRNALEVISEAGRQTVDEMRTVLGVLRSNAAVRKSQPGLANLDQLAATMDEAGLQVTVSVEGQPNHPLPQVVDLSAYRIVQEALTNTLKHAGSARSTVTVTYRKDCVELQVSDSGTAVTAGLGTGNGLVGMRERAAMLGGEFEAEQTPTGFHVRARLPLADSAPS